MSENGDPPESPREAGKNMQNPEEIDSNDDEERDPAKEAAMKEETPNPTHDTTEQLKNEINTVLPGSDPLENLSAAQTGPLHYTVLSARNGSVTSHRVNIKTLRCSCEDMTFNKEGASVTPESEGGQEICAHLAFALLNHPQLTAEEMSTYQSMGLMQQSENLRDQLDMQLDRFDDALQELRAANADQQSESQQTTTESSETASSNDTSSTHEDLQPKVEKLKEAYDAVVEDMQVQHHDGFIWVKTGMDTPDQLPGPGNVNVWEAFIQNPEQIEYVHDDHPAAGNKPGEYWKNRMEPIDVEEYISEVLE